MINQKLIELNNSDQIVSSSDVWWEYIAVNRMSLEWNINDTNEVHTSTASWADACISNRSVESDGDIIASIGWGDGFAIRRLENNGSLTELYNDYTPMDSYPNLTNLTLDKINYKAYVGTYVYDGIMVYDYSACASGGSAVVKDGEINPEPDQCGHYYSNGIYIVGNYLYLLPNEFSTSTCRRYNVSTSSQDDLAVTYVATNGRYGEIWYDEDNNRIYMIYNGDGGIWVVTNPEKASDDGANPAKCYNINITTLTGSNDIYTYTVAPDKTNPNYLWVCGYYGRYLKIDITDVLNETSATPTLLDKNDIWYNRNNQINPIKLAGFHSAAPHPIHKSDLILISPDRDYNCYYGWLDTENMMPVTNSIYYGYNSNGVTKYRYDSTDAIRYSYGPLPILAQSADGTKYWVTAGYAQDGHKFRTYSESTSGFSLKESGEIIFGDFQLENAVNIKTLQILNLKDSVYEPSNCTFNVLISNNSGSDWETYGWATEDLSVFSSVGDTLQVKFEFTGYNGIRCPYIFSTDETHIIIKISDEKAIDDYSKNSRYKIQGV